MKVLSLCESNGIFILFEVSKNKGEMRIIGCVNKRNAN